MKHLICIMCPRGCELTVSDDLKVTGNQCPIGQKYAYNEMTAPKRMLTSTVKIKSKQYKRLPVITSSLIPKEMMFQVIQEINKVSCTAPIKIHDVIIKNVLNLNVDIIATRTILE